MDESGLSRRTRKGLRRDGFSRETIAKFEQAGLTDRDIDFDPELGALISVPGAQKLGRFVGGDFGKRFVEFAAEFQRSRLHVPEVKR
jgi:hypothetical protein